MIITVDTNILISALINSKGKEFAILKKSYRQIDFVSSVFLLKEFSQKSNKVAALTNSSPADVRYQFRALSEQFLWVKENELDNVSLQEAERLIQHIDPKDFWYVAVAVYFDSLLWSGDMKLYKGLRRKGFKNIVTTKELSEIIKGI